MKRAIKKKSTIYEYLEPFLESGSDADIAAARKRYWKEYKAKYRKEKKKEHKEFTVSFTKGELTTISKMAEVHRRSSTRFIKEATLAYCRKQFLVPDIFALNYIREQLALNYTALQNLEESNIISPDTELQLSNMFSELERNILTALQNPKTVEEEIQEALKANPEQKDHFFKILKNEYQ